MPRKNPITITLLLVTSFGLLNVCPIALMINITTTKLNEIANSIVTPPSFVRSNH